MTSNQEPLPALCYRIGKRSCEIRNLAEHFWTVEVLMPPGSPDEGVLPESLQDVYQALHWDLQTIERRNADRHPLTIVATECRMALTTAFEAFKQAWRSSDHDQLIRDVPMEPELGQINILRNMDYMLRQSPLLGSAWDAFDTSVIRFEETLDHFDQVAFELGTLLHLVDNLPWTGRHRFDNFGNPLVSHNVLRQRYIDAYLLPKIEALWSNAVLGFSQLVRHSFSASSKRDRDVLREVCEDAFKQEPSTDVTKYAPYQLIIDNRRQSIARLGKAVQLNQREWILVKAVLADPQQRLTKGVLETNLNCRADSAQQQTVSRLRRRLSPLKLTLKCERGYGWRLTDEAN